MRRFWSYGPINTDSHYYAPRKELIEQVRNRLLGEKPNDDSHYITVWAPRQCGKTWVMQEVVQRIKQTNRYEIGILTMERAKEEKDEKGLMGILVEKLEIAFNKSFPTIDKIQQLPDLFTKHYFQKPVILILDEFDALEEVFINRLAGIFRDIYINRINEKEKSGTEKTYLLQGLSLVGVRSVLGIENQKGSPFNVQRSIHIPGLSFDEVRGIFQWYETESGQPVEPQVVERLYYETRGQPGLTCWMGELLSEGFEDYTNDRSRPISPAEFETVYYAAIAILPNNNILNLISKARETTTKSFILKLFQTGEKMEFRFDNTIMNELYLNGVIDKEKGEDSRYYARFSCPFVQKRLFNYFSDEFFHEMGQLVQPFIELDKVISPTHLDIKELLKLYQKYLELNKAWLFKDVPRRSDLRVYEAIFHFNLYSYLDEFLRSRKGRVYPEFPTGNGKIDLLIRYNNNDFGIELKSFTHRAGYEQALSQATQYGKQLGIKEIFLVNFVEAIDEKTKREYETDYFDARTGVTVKSVILQTGTV